MNTQTKPPVKFIKSPLVEELTGWSKSTLRRRIREGLFVPPCSLGDRAIAFLELETNTILVAMAAGKNQDDIKTLVKSLVEQRQQLAA